MQCAVLSNHFGESKKEYGSKFHSMKSINGMMKQRKYSNYQCIREETEVVLHSTKMFHFLPRRQILWTPGRMHSENKGIGIALPNAFESTMRSCIAQRRDGVASTDKQSKTMDV